MTAPMAIGPLLTQGLRTEFAMAYEPAYAGVMGDIGEVMWADATSDKLQEVFGVILSPLHPVRWDPGNIIGSRTILSRQFTITNRDFGRRVYLPRNVEDDQTGRAVIVARRLGANWGLLPERIFYQFITGATDNDLLPAIPNSEDGNALYLTSTRYGSSDGNVVTQTGSSTVQQIITDLFSMLRRFIEFQDTESQPYWADSEIRRNGVSLFYGSSLTLLMQQAAAQMVVHSTIAGSSTTNVQTGAGVSNTVIASGIPIKWINSQRITNTRIYCFLRNQPSDKRALVRMIRKPLQEHVGNYETSDHTRDTGEQYVQFDSREGWGSCLAIGTIRIS